MPDQDRKSASGWKLWVSGLIALLISAVSLNTLLVGIDHPITDLYFFRQAQTAISSYWMIEEGFTLAYITPVLGPPWSIPFEFPSFQILVAGTHQLLGTPLDATGRAVSITFFFVAVGAVAYLLLVQRNPGWAVGIVLGVFLLSPFYLFWSRAFLVEAMALAFGLLFAGATIRFAIRPRRILIFIALIVGAIAALTKITTFGICAAFTLSFIGLLVLEKWFLERRGASFSDLTPLFHAALLATFAIGVSLLWNIYADSLKAHNPMATFILSENLNRWNFGSVDQRLEAKTWIKVWERVGIILGTPGFVVIGMFSFASIRQSKLAVASIIAFFSGILVFTNLYVVHEYYFFANGFFLLLFLCSGILSLIEYGSPAAALAVLLTVFSGQHLQYHNRYPGAIAHAPHHSVYKVGETVRQLTSPDDVVLIYGADWDSTIPYYSQRKAIMDRAQKDLENPAVRASLSNLGEQNIGAVLFCNYSGNPVYSPEFIRIRVSRFSLTETATEIGHCSIYPRAGR